jgi:tetratricopeptide (TPR) repeat protein
MDVPTPKKSLNEIITLATEYVNQQRYQEAINECTLGIKQYVSARLYHLRAEAYVNRAKYDCALSDYAAAIELDQRNPEYWFNCGNILLRLKRYTQALSHFRKALIRDSRHVPARIALGRVYSLKNDSLAALWQYNKVLQQEPDNVLALHNRACVRYNIHQVELALNDFNRIIELNPAFLPAIEARLFILLEKREHAKVKLDGYYLLKYLPSSELVHLALAGVYHAEMNHAVACLHYAQAYYFAVQQDSENLRSCWVHLKRFIKQLDCYTGLKEGISGLAVKDQIWLLYYILQHDFMLSQLNKLYEKTTTKRPAFYEAEVPILKATYQKMTQDRVNVRLVARLIAQGQRDQSVGSVFRFFANIPTEIGVKIAAHVGGPTLPQAEAEMIALRHFCKP